MLIFDHSYPCERGYGYVGASRFRAATGIFYFGTIRRSDWLPIRQTPDQQESRLVDSDSTDSRDADDRLNDSSSGDDNVEPGSALGHLDAIMRDFADGEIGSGESSDSDGDRDPPISLQPKGAAVEGGDYEAFRLL